MCHLKIGGFFETKVCEIEVGVEIGVEVRVGVEVLGVDVGNSPTKPPVGNIHQKIFHIESSTHLILLSFTETFYSPLTLLIRH